ncbi:hypothetical protein DPEC_G00051130 [Dallia pectoralis]|uniref:Uncharacterized protein n=1 Tax=Dallia pectoralis TaxID=75939 RepID=A0ACC2HBD8_DALPE|nr:hypothetical protein DPEC_G00051130 [Dallia pectoralis]
MAEEMAKREIIFLFAFALLSGFHLSDGKISGAEISGTRQNGSAAYCLTSCQLHRQQALLDGNALLRPQCQASGEYQPVQCDRV